MIDGVHYVRSQRNGLIPKWYIYAWRGGPCIMTHLGRTKPRLTEAALQELARLRSERHTADSRTLAGLIASFRRSPDWKNLAESTRRTWGSQLDKIENKWADTPLTVWSDARMKAKVVAWRDSRSDSPRGADLGITVLSKLLGFGELRGALSRNVASGIPTLYKGGGRALIIWTEDDIRRFREHAEALGQMHIYDGLRLAALTGLRRQDLVTLTFDNIQVDTLEKLATKRSRQRRFRVVIPRFPELDLLLEELRTRHRQPGVNTVLVNSYGYPWSGDGFTGSFNRIRDLAEVVGMDAGGRNKKKHLHDLRGTFCTKLCQISNLTTEEVAMVMGWSVDQVAEIRRAYVDHDTLVVSLAQKLRRGV